ncbi:hypothetical protein PanWU01x14_267360 [Parasponia andersonii]|uniref:Uncharacterized protein n=1 Tax=Parasponia andersonii TaxID=3476 RepID=A0A2P5B6E4_PARAD|nr:hypothetical protein PanWU01x14_267360 [Parasponia andersonii]
MIFIIFFSLLFKPLPSEAEMISMNRKSLLGKVSEELNAVHPPPVEEYNIPANPPPVENYNIEHEVPGGANPIGNHHQPPPGVSPPS